jgi:hypothetical protein
MSKISFMVTKQNLRSFQLTNDDGDKIVEHVVKVDAREIDLSKLKDNNNPRSHHDNMKGAVVRAIDDLLDNEPANYATYNRGGIVIGESVHVEDRGTHLFVSINMPLDENKPDGTRALHGACDGATSLYRCQLRQKKAKLSGYKEDADFRDEQNVKYARQFKAAGIISGSDIRSFTSVVSEGGKLTAEQEDVIAECINIKDVPSVALEYYNLDKILIPLTIYSGDIEPEFIQGLCEARNTSKQVKDASLANHASRFQWLKVALADQPYASNIAYDENAAEDINVVDILAVVNGFRQEFVNTEGDDGNEPVKSYNSKGSITAEFSRKKNAEATQEEFKKLIPIIPAILKMHDIVARDMPVGRRRPKSEEKIKSWPFEEKTTELYFLQEETDKFTHKGLRYPVLFALRALVDFDAKTGEAYWIADPEEFWESNKDNLVDLAMTIFKKEQNFKPHECGRSASTYRQLRDRAEKLFWSAKKKAI